MKQVIKKVLKMLGISVSKSNLSNRSLWSELARLKQSPIVMQLGK